MVIVGIIAGGMDSEEVTERLQGAVSILLKGYQHDIYRNEGTEHAPFPFRLRHLLPQSGAIQGLEKLECAEQIF